jgi:hypothetical protein
MVRLLRLAQLERVFVGQPGVGPVGDDANGLLGRFAQKRSASGSALTPCTRSSVDRSTREINDVMMIVTMKNDAIFSPSGRSAMFTNVV